MEAIKKFFKYVSLVAMLIASSASNPTVEKGLDLPTRMTETQEAKMARYRLPEHTIPHLYTIYLEPDMVDDDFSWTGKVSILIQVLSRTTSLTLHAHDNLGIIEPLTTLTDARGSKLIPVTQTRAGLLEILTLQFDRLIVEGNYTLSMKFSGTQTWDLLGMFSVKLADGSVIVGTNFSPTSARRAFPCWDEPEYKAQFSVSIRHSPLFIAISNMPELKHAFTPDGDYLTTFDTTPYMSPHLLNFVISQHKTYFNEHLNVSLHASYIAAEKIGHVFGLSSKVVHVMESYTGLPFGFPRIGSVLMPVYPSSGVEHWGLITYDESVLNGDDRLVTSAEKDETDLLIAHELSHAWFGNRVTPFWWDDIWLSEAFAEYFQYYIMDQIDDNWRGMELFIVMNNQEAAFPVDVDKNMPARWTPITPAEIRLMFKPQSVRKGSAIIHMFRNGLGDEVFQAGIKEFMAKHSFKTVVSEDLIFEFQDAYNKRPNKDKSLDIAKAMISWLEQKGYPMVTVTRNYDTGATTVSQESTLLDDHSGKWWIPLSYATKSNPNFTSTLPAKWISDEEHSVVIDRVDNDDWIVLNVQASGYYRVNYDDTNWRRIAQYLDSDDYQNIHVLNRAQLINDAFYLFQLEPDRYYSNFFSIIKYMTREVEYLPWRAAHSAVTHILDTLPRGSDAHRLLQYYILKLVENFLLKVGFEPKDTDDHLTKLSRTDIVDWACMAGHVECGEFASRKIIQLASNTLEFPLHPDIKGWAFCAGLRGLNATLGNLFATWAYQNERDALLARAGCTNDHEIHRSLLHKTLTKNKVGDAHEMNIVIKSLVTSTEDNFNYAVDFFLENHQAMNRTFVAGNWVYELSSTLHSFVDEVKTQERLQKFNKILLLEEVDNDPYIHTDTLLNKANENVEKSVASTKKFNKFWDKRMTSENAIITVIFV